jgi:hypothetical protein
MSIWSEDLANLSQEEIIRLQAENRLWSKELRRDSAALTNGRLANQISLADYAARRRAGNDNRAECQRRARTIANEIQHRGLVPR